MSQWSANTSQTFEEDSTMRKQHVFSLFPSDAPENWGALCPGACTKPSSLKEGRKEGK